MEILRKFKEIFKKFYGSFEKALRYFWRNIKNIVRKVYENFAEILKKLCGNPEKTLKISRWGNVKKSPDILRKFCGNLQIFIYEDILRKFNGNLVKILKNFEKKAVKIKKIFAILIRFCGNFVTTLR